VFTRSVSRSGRPHEVGDDVRIQSLGFEGVLRFVGEIEGKAGLWAGVELSGGFSGKGKNNGSVNG
jgi:dynactin complex subunit